MKSIPNRISIQVFVLLLAGMMTPFAVAAEPTITNANQPDLPEVAQGVPMGGLLRIADLDLDQFGNVDLELERFTVFAPDVKILIDGQAPISAPNNAYFRGSINDLPNAIVVLTVPEHGKMRGIITDKSGVWRLSGNSGRSAPGLGNKKLDEDEIAKLPPFICNTDKLPINIGNFVGGTSSVTSSDTAALPANVTHTARVAVETDYEYYAKFGNATAATDYTGDLFAYISTVYEQEANTNLVISFLRLWPGGAAIDPWTVTSGTLAALNEYTAYWNANMGAEVRTVAHMLSGKFLGGGIAYVGALCSTSFGYGLSADLLGNFDINNPSVVWDIVVVSHEIGHNFNSPHTHDYCNIGGNTSPVDLCANSTASCGTVLGLPGIASLTGGVTANRPGTIMSYCHQLPGQISNIAFTFGKDHIYGVAANRVPLRMYDHVVSSASAFPGCLTLIDNSTQLTVTKSGSGTITSTPAGINCGNDCSESYTQGTSVTLTPTPSSGWSFTGWGGACSGTGSCVVVMTAATSVSATFTPNVGAKFYPLTPCRIFDSRIAGVGPLAAGISRAYWVYGSDAGIQSQGGTGDCGVPSTARAVVINLTSTEALGNGHFRIFPFKDSLTSASIVNFNNGVTMANATEVPICQPLCAFDIMIFSSVIAHVIGDVMGYIQ